ncbi:hypothetical protein ABZT23_31925 [Streptomyces sp. NPDC005386]|uniref:hypothetical protein n=1 Tax=Streptomyces sp. NPDC005386 TaxID=3154562 RepID=UPI0033BCD823
MAGAPRATRIWPKRSLEGATLDELSQGFGRDKGGIASRLGKIEAAGSAAGVA